MMRASSVTSVARTSLFTQRSLPRSSRARIGAVRCMEIREMNKNKETGQLVDPKVALSVAGLLAPFAECSPAQAIGREYGILEGQIFSLMHPAFMFFLLGSSVYAGYLGFQWRRTRELATEIKELKAQRDASVRPDAEGSEMASSPLDGAIKNLENERKELIGQRLNEKHFNWGSLILGLGVLMSIAGPCNTFLRTGKLFPGPHLYAGASMTVLWALAAALVPAMQKGNDTARSLHIAFNAVNILLFIWQVPTGLEIVGKVFQFTTLP